MVVTVESFEFLMAGVVVRFYFRRLFSNTAGRVLGYVLSVFDNFGVVLLGGLLGSISLSFYRCCFICEFLFSFYRGGEPPVVCVLP